MVSVIPLSPKIACKEPIFLLCVSWLSYVLPVSYQETHRSLGKGDISEGEETSKTLYPSKRHLDPKINKDGAKELYIGC